MEEEGKEDQDLQHYAISFKLIDHAGADADIRKISRIVVVPRALSSSVQ